MTEEMSKPEPTAANQCLLLETIFWACGQGMKPLVIAQREHCIIIQDLETRILLPIHYDEADQEVLKVMTIANALSLTPSDELKEMTFTSDLLSEWKTHKWLSNLVGRVFIFICLESRVVDPLEEERKNLHQSTANVIEMEAFFYQSLWNLIKTGFGEIKEKIPSLPFNTPEELTIEIIQEERNSRFECILSNNWIQFLTDEALSLWDNDSDLDRKKIIERIDPSKTLSRRIWFPRILPILHKHSKKRQIIKAQLQTYEVAIDNLKHAFIDFLKARTEKGKLVKSYVWQDGEQHFLDRYNRPSISRADHNLRYKT